MTSADAEDHRDPWRADDRYGARAGPGERLPSVRWRRFVTWHDDEKRPLRKVQLREHAFKVGRALLTPPSAFSLKSSRRPSVALVNAGFRDPMNRYEL